MSSHVRAIQTTLKDAGFYKGAIDGIAGPQTVAAVKQAVDTKLLTTEQKNIITQANASDPTLVTPQGTTTAVKASGFVLSDRSLNNLRGVKEPLVRVVKRAIEISSVDFVVIEGVRTAVRQAQLVKQGASQTMKSKHLTGDAVDIVPIIDGKISWNFNDYYPIAMAMANAAKELGVTVRWGGAWTVITGKAGTPQEWVKAYTSRGGRFTDGPHFELM